MNKPLVILESPYDGDIEVDVQYARAALRDCLLRGEAPIASHLLYTQPGVLDDAVPEERALGIAAGLEWVAVAAVTVVYADLGISEGMEQGIARARAAGNRVELRSLPGWVGRWCAMSEPVTDAELLALAKQVWAGDASHISFSFDWTGDHWARVLDINDCLLIYVVHPRPRKAMHAALLALLQVLHA